MMSAEQKERIRIEKLIKDQWASSSQPTKQLRRYVRLYLDHVHEVEADSHPERAYTPAPVDSSQLQSSSAWTEMEQDVFFASIARHSRWRPDLIADDINTATARCHAFCSSSGPSVLPSGKTTLQVQIYISRMEAAKVLLAKELVRDGEEDSRDGEDLVERNERYTGARRLFAVSEPTLGYNEILVLRDGLAAHPSARELPEEMVIWEEEAARRLVLAEATDQALQTQDLMQDHDEKEADDSEDDDDDPDERLANAYWYAWSKLSDRAEMRCDMRGAEGETVRTMTGRVCLPAEFTRSIFSHRRDTGAALAWHRHVQAYPTIVYPSFKDTFDMRPLLARLAEKGWVFCAETSADSSDGSQTLHAMDSAAGRQRTFEKLNRKQYYQRSLFFIDPSPRSHANDADSDSHNVAAIRRAAKRHRRADKANELDVTTPEKLTMLAACGTSREREMGSQPEVSLASWEMAGELLDRDHLKLMVDMLNPVAVARLLK